MMGGSAPPMIAPAPAMDDTESEDFVVPATAPVPEPEPEPEPYAEEGEAAAEEYMVVLYDYAAVEPDDLELTEGDVVCIFEKGEHWSRGCKAVGDGWSEEGNLPTAYLGPYEQ